MEHRLLLQLLQHQSPQDHTSGFFNVCGSAAHFRSPGGGFAAPVVPADYGWAAPDLAQLGGELFDGGATSRVGAVAGHQPWQCDGGASDDPPPPPACVPLDGDGDGTGSPPSWEQGGRQQASEPNRDDGNNVAGSRKKRDRGKIIVSERKRRVRMKEKLYELRALVPNITKMDKASIIADAVEYVKNLQSHTRKLKEEVAALEARPQHDRRSAAANRRQDGDDDDAGSTARSGGGARHGARVARVGATRVGEGRFLVTVECERRDGAAAHLYAAVESLPCFRVESSSLDRPAPDRIVSTLTLKATCQADSATIGEGTVKLLVVAALGEEGFRPEATAGLF